MMSFWFRVGVCWGCLAAGVGFAQTPADMIAEQVPAALRVIDQYHGDAAGKSQRTLHIVYWTPKDREPAPLYRERLTRVLLDIREFYLTHMQRLGFGARTFELQKEADGLLKIHLVRGESDYAHYDVQSGSAIRRECLPTLRQAGIQAQRETIVLFCNMSNWDAQASTINQNSPYYASGGLRSGTAWQVDSPILDAASLSAKSPMLRDGQYGRISLGKYNSIFVGGVCHELGHALGLPHNQERSDEREAFGTALMGSGNRTYGDDLRGEGRGSFLTLGEALRLASHPLFTRSEKGIDLPASAQLSNVQLELTSDRRAFNFSAQVQADPPAYAVIAYMDPAGGSDYDATTTTAIPDEQGKFTLRAAALKAGSKGALRIVVCQANGGRINDRTLEIPYSVDATGVVDVAAYYATQKLQELSMAVAQQNLVEAKKQLEKLRGALNIQSDARLLDAADSLVASLDRSAARTPAATVEQEVWLSTSAWQDASVGWGEPLADRLPEDSPLLLVGGQLFAHGLYAHAPSQYSYDLSQKWKRFTAQAGLADGHDGSVEFVIELDGKEAWRSKKITDDTLAQVDLDVSQVSRLTLRVENAGDDNGGDWGVWCEPKLLR